MKESPLYRRRQARGISIEDAAYINRAQRDVVTETIGREVGGLGAAISEALAKGKKKNQAKEAEKQQAKQTLENNRAAQDNKLQEMFKGATDTNYDGKLGIGLELPPPPTVSSTTDTSGDSGGGLASYDEAWSSNLEGIRGMYPNKTAYIADRNTKGKETEARRAWAQKNLEKGQTYNEAIHGNAYLASLTDSPIQRKQSRAYSNELAGLYSVDVPGPVAGSDDKSQYTAGKTFVEKERLLSAPSWMGSAAVEGYNMTVQARNYEKQVQADTQDYYNEKLKGLDPGRTGYNIIDDSINEVVMDQQSKFIEHQKQRNQWFSEGRGPEWITKEKEYTALSDNILNGKDALKGKLDQFVEGLEGDTIDVGMSDPRVLDFYNSLLKGGSVIGIADLGQGPSLAGGTRREEPIDMNLATIQQTLNSMKLVEKQEPMEFYNTFTSNLKNGKIPGVEKEIVEGPDGFKVSKYNMNQIDQVIDVYIKEELKSIADAKGYGGALLNMSHGQWEASTDAGDDPRAAVANKMKKDLMNILGPLAGFESREGTARATSIMKERIAKDKEGRSVETKTSTKQKKEDNLNSLIDFIMQEGEKSYSPDKIVEGETAIPELTMKTTGADYPGASVIEGAKGVKTTSFNPNTGILTIQPSAAITVKDGSTTVKTTEPQTIDFTQDPAIVRQNLYNLLEQLKITGPSNNTEGGQSVTTTTKESNFRKKYNY